VFNYIGRMNIILEVNPLLLTCNNGGLDGDLLTLSYNNTITINGTPYQPFTGYSGDLTLGFDNITDADSLVGDSSSIEDWNLFFELPGWSTEFTDLVINEDEVTLIGGENIVLLSSRFKFSNIVSLVDQGCIAYIANNCFEESSLVTIDLAKLATTGSEYCFYNCQSLVSVSLPELTTTGNFYFQGCSALTDVSLPLLTTSGDYSFAGCSALESINLPALITAGYSCFYECTSLVSVSLVQLTSISGECFRSCTSLTTINLPNLISADESCFYDCSALESISLPELVTVGNNCFVFCDSLISISLPLCNDLGGGVGNNDVFSDISGKNIELTIPVALMTCNNGQPDGDIQILQANNTVAIITT
jgi:hypothetical protein